MPFRTQSIGTAIILGATVAGAFGGSWSGTAFRETRSTWIGGDGAWSDPSHWQSVWVTSSTSANLFAIDGGNCVASHVMLDVDASMQGLEISPGDELAILPGRTLTLTSPMVASLRVDGSIRLPAGPVPARVVLGAPRVMLDGLGVITLEDAIDAQVVPAVDGMLLENAVTLAGAGRLGTGTRFDIANAHVIAADRPFERLTIDAGGGAMLNTGSIIAHNNGRLTLRGVNIDNGSGIIEVNDDAVIDLDHASISGGTIRSTGNGLVQNYAPAALSNVRIEGLYETGPTSLTLSGQIINDGSIALVANDTVTGEEPVPSELVIAGPGPQVALEGEGELRMRFTRVRADEDSYGTTLINGAGHTVRGDGMIGDNSIGFINNGTLIADRPSVLLIDPVNTQTCENNGVIRATGVGGVFFLGGMYRNNGVLEVHDGSAITFGAGCTCLNVTAASLMGGTWRVISSGQPTSLNLTGPALLTNQADVTISGFNASIPSLNGVTNNQGTLRVLNGAVFTSNGNFKNKANALLVLSADSTFEVAGTFTQYGTGRLRIEVGPPSYDVNGNEVTGGVRVNGNAALNGTLEIAFAPGYVPTNDRTVPLLSAQLLSGAFTTIIAPEGVDVSIGDGQVGVIIEAMCPGDLDDDDFVGIGDLLDVIAGWGACPIESCPADVNNDHSIGITDLLAIIAAWGPCHDAATD